MHGPPSRGLRVSHHHLSVLLFSSPACVLVRHDHEVLRGGVHNHSLTPEHGLLTQFSFSKWFLFAGVCSRGNQLSPILGGESADLRVFEMCSQRASSSIYTDFYNQCLNVKVDGKGGNLVPTKTTGITPNCASHVHLWPDAKD